MQFVDFGRETILPPGFISLWLRNMCVKTALSQSTHKSVTMACSLLKCLLKCCTSLAQTASILSEHPEYEGGENGNTPSNRLYYNLKYTFLTYCLILSFLACWVWHTLLVNNTVVITGMCVPHERIQSILF